MRVADADVVARRERGEGAGGSLLDEDDGRRRRAGRCLELREERDLCLELLLLVVLTVSLSAAAEEEEGPSLSWCLSCLSLEVVPEDDLRRWCEEPAADCLREECDRNMADSKARGLGTYRPVRVKT